MMTYLYFTPLCYPLLIVFSPALYKYGSLSVLTIQNSLLILSMRYTRVQSGDMYITTTAVVLSETIKVLICLLVLFFQNQTLQQYFLFLYQNIILNWQDTLKLSIPALVYMIQNNLQYVAVSNLEAAVFQVTYQFKILTTAVFSVLMLSKKLSTIQWWSLVTLFIGVALVQVQKTASSDSTHTQNQIIGLLSVIISCLSSGFAGVYVEKVIKGSPASFLFLRNLQLSLFCALTAVIGMWITDGSNVYSKGFFHGYNVMVWFVVIQQAVGGIIVSLVVKYADNILKGFSTSLSIIISCVASVFLFSYTITLQFVIGTTLVILSIYLYGRYQPKVTPKEDKLNQLEQKV